MRMFFIVGAVAVALAGCQSAEQSYQSAKDTCIAAGNKVGSARYNKCVNATYNSNRRQSQDATNAATVGIAAAAVGGAVLGASTNRHRYYGRSYYGRPYYGRRGYYW